MTDQTIREMLNAAGFTDHPLPESARTYGKREIRDANGKAVAVLSAHDVAEWLESQTRPEPASHKLVREFSPIGPCLTLGLFVKRTPKSIMYREWLGGNRYADKISRVGGWKVQEQDGRRGYIHTEPCPSCRDHEKTQYPNGYMD